MDQVSIICLRQSMPNQYVTELCYFDLDQNRQMADSEGVVMWRRDRRSSAVKRLQRAERALALVTHGLFMPGAEASIFFAGYCAGGIPLLRTCRGTKMGQSDVGPAQPHWRATPFFEKLNLRLPTRKSSMPQSQPGALAHDELAQQRLRFVWVGSNPDSQQRCSSNWACAVNLRARLEARGLLTSRSRSTRRGSG
jgi:hypothetical protein